jgi:hypothetical protein
LRLGHLNEDGLASNIGCALNETCLHQLNHGLRFQAELAGTYDKVLSRSLPVHHDEQRAA